MFCINARTSNLENAFVDLQLNILNTLRNAMIMRTVRNYEMNLLPFKLAHAELEVKIVVMIV